MERLTQLSPSVDLLAAVLRSRDGSCPDGVDPRQVLHACRDEEVSALVYHLLRPRPAFPGWPDAVREDLARQAREATARELAAADELRRVLHALAGARVTPLLFKGTALAYQIYDEPGIRTRCDSDLLIRREDRAATRRVLASIGYTAPAYSDGEMLFAQFPMVRADRFGLAHWLDVHWEISAAKAFAQLVTYEELAKQSVALERLGPHAVAPGLSHALLLSCIHPAMHHRNVLRLLWSYDVHALANRMDAAAWRDFAALATERRVRAVCAHSLQRASTLLGSPVPEAVATALALPPGETEPTARYLDPTRGWTDEVASDLRALATWGDRVRLARDIAMPSADYMLSSYGLSASRLGRALLPALYVHRGIRGAWRVVTGRK